MNKSIYNLYDSDGKTKFLHFTINNKKYNKNILNYNLIYDIKLKLEYFKIICSQDFVLRLNLLDFLDLLDYLVLFE